MNKEPHIFVDDVNPMEDTFNNTQEMQGSKSITGKPGVDVTSFPETTFINKANKCDCGAIGIHENWVHESWCASIDRQSQIINKASLEVDNG